MARSDLLEAIYEDAREEAAWMRNPWWPCPLCGYEESKCVCERCEICDEKIPPNCAYCVKCNEEEA